MHQRPQALRQRAWVTTALGLVCGALAGSGLGGAGMGWADLAGTVLAVSVVATLAVAPVIAAASRPLGRLIVRALGSWLAASGLLWLGWSLR